MCNEFNELRSEMVLLYELKNALAACEQELHSLKGQFEAACPGKVLNFIVTPKVFFLKVHGDICFILQNILCRFK
jgi:hypothetical protein